jgi:hypothetical protein
MLGGGGKPGSNPVRFVIFFFLNLLEAGDGAIEGTLQPAFIVSEQAQAAVRLSENFKCSGEPQAFIEVLIGVPHNGVLAIHLAIKHSSLDDPETAKAPAGVRNLEAEIALQIG